MLNALKFEEKKMKKISLVMIFVVVFSVFSTFTPQANSLMGPEEPPETEWCRTYGGTSDDLAWSIIKTDDGGYALAGWTRSFGAGAADFWLVKTDANGTMEWNQTYGGPSNDYAYSVVQTGDGGYAIAGETSSFGAGNRDFWLVKTDANGTMEWNQTYGGTNQEEAYSVIQTSDGGYAIAGRTLSFGAGWEDVWLVKTDANGTMEWNQTYGGVQGDFAYSVVETGDGGYAIAGETASFGAGQRDFWLIKTDSSGNHEWNKTYGGAAYDARAFMNQTADGGYALAGFANSFGAGEADFWLIKTDANGNMQWNKTYGGTGRDEVWSVVQTGDGGYAIAGETSSFGAGGWDFWLVKTDANGTMEWNQTYGGASNDCAYSVVETGDGGYAIAGRTLSFGAGAADFWLIKLGPKEISATVDIDPDTLNLKSNGQWITAYITLPEGYNVADIDLSTVQLEGIPAIIDAQYGFVTDPASYLVDHDGDGVLERMVKFERATVRDTLTGTVDYEEGVKFYDLTLTVTGELVDGTPFEGSDTITVIKK